MKKNNSLKMNKFIILAIVFLFGLIILKLIQVGLFKTVDDMDLTAFSNNRNTAKETLYATRGTIYDYNGDVLAKNVNSYTVIAYLSDSRTTNSNHPQHVIDKDMTAKALEPVLNMSYDLLMKLLSSDLYQVELGPNGRGITELKKEEIQALDLPGIDFIASSKRYYKMNSFASYLIGYARKNNDNVITGEMGIEKAYNDVLSGTDGFREYQKDAYGYQIPNTPSITKSPVSGADIYLTIDNNIQLILENVIANLKKDYQMDWLTISVMEAKTGRIVGSASTPSFNLNTLDDVKSYLNPLVSYQYEPGSTMKIFSFLAAMENNIYDGNKLYQSGTVNVADAVIKDFNNVGWGKISFDTGFSYSSNVAATYLALDLGNSKLRSFYEKCGFGSLTNIELPNETKGLINFKYKSELANASFGQGVTISPIQMLQALSIIANDGDMLKPYIIDRIVYSDGKIDKTAEKTIVRNVASKKNIDYMKNMMKDVVYSNLTDAKYYKANNITVIGKTGTAQIATSGGYLNGKYDYVRSFAGLFPYENPEYIIYYATSKFVGPISTVAKQVATAIEEIAKYKDIVEVESSLDETKIIKVSNYLNKPVEDVLELLNEQGIIPVVIGTGDKVSNQYPKADSIVLKGNKVFLKTNSNTILMPDITGYTSAEVVAWCNIIGLKYELNGYGKVVGSSIDIGSEINKNTKIVVNLSK